MPTSEDRNNSETPEYSPRLGYRTPVVPGFLDPPESTARRVNRGGWLLLTGGWTTTCVLLLAFGHGLLATVLLALALAIPRGDPRRDPGPGTAILGVCLGAMAALGGLEAGYGAVWGGLVALASGGLWIARARRDGPPAVRSMQIALVLSGAAITETVRVYSGHAALASGQDLATVIYAVLPLLLASAAAAGVTRHLHGRHPKLGTYLPPILAGVTVMVAVASHDLESGRDVAVRVHGPDVSRAQFLFGTGLLAWLLGVKAALVAGACAGLARPRSLGGGTISMLLGGACALQFPSSLGSLFGATMGSLAFAPTAQRLRPALLLGAVLLVLFKQHEPGVQVLRVDDPVRTWMGTDPADLSGSEGASRAPSAHALDEAVIAGRSIRAPQPPGWPVGDDDLASALDYIARRSGAPVTTLLGPEAPFLIPGSDARRPPDDGRSLTLLPGAFALPLHGLIHDLRRLTHGIDEARPVRAAILDLAEVSLRDVTTVATALTDGGRPPELAIAGTLAVLIGGHNVRAPGEPDPAAATLPHNAAPALPHDAAPALSQPAVAHLSQSWPPKPEMSLLDRSARWRRSSRSPELAAHNLRALLARADQLRPMDDPNDPHARRSFSQRVRLALCAAILDDDAEEEERLLRLLRRLGASDVAGLREARETARAALLRFAKDARDRDPTDADARYRLGKILMHRGAPLAAIDEMTLAIDRLRPLMTECYTALAEAYIRAERRGERRVVAGKDQVFVLDGTRIVPALQQVASRHHQGAWPQWLVARAETSRGEANVMAAEREGVTAELREQHLADAAGRFQAALAVEPLFAPALRGLAHSLILLGVGNPARYAREAVAADPLNEDGHALLARVTTRVQERERSTTAWLFLR